MSRVKKGGEVKMIEKELISGKEFVKLINEYINSYPFTHTGEGSNLTFVQSLGGWLESLRQHVLERYKYEKSNKKGAIEK
jgi:hypothetical protein